MTKIINTHKHILDLDPLLNKVIPSSSVFVSHRSAKNLKDILISSKLPKGPVAVHDDLDINHIDNGYGFPRPSIASRNVQATIDINAGVVSCNKCYLCKYYLQVCDQFSSFHTEQIFKHKSRLTCDTECIIYLCECITHRVSYTGYTINAIKCRFSTNKSHIKNNDASCEFVKHIIECEHCGIDFSSRNKYDETLSKHVRVTILEQVRVEKGDNRAQREAKCEAREGYWQTQLKTLNTYGGLNVRDSRKYISQRQQGIIAS